MLMFGLCFHAELNLTKKNFFNTIWSKLIQLDICIMYLLPYKWIREIKCVL